MAAKEFPLSDFHDTPSQIGPSGSISEPTPTSSGISLACAPGYTGPATEDVEHPSAVGSPGPAAQGLRQIVGHLHEVEMELLDAGGELTPKLQEDFGAAVIAKEKKVDAYAAILKRCKTVAIEFKAKAESLTAVAKAAENLEKYLKDNLKEAAKILGVDELIGDTQRFKITNAQPKMIIENMALIPREFVNTITTVTVNVEAVQAALMRGEKIPGVSWVVNKKLNTYAVKAKLK